MRFDKVQLWILEKFVMSAYIAVPLIRRAVPIFRGISTSSGDPSSEPGARVSRRRAELFWRALLGETDVFGLRALFELEPMERSPWEGSSFDGFNYVTDVDAWSMWE